MYLSEYRGIIDRYQETVTETAMLMLSEYDLGISRVDTRDGYKGIDKDHKWLRACERYSSENGAAALRIAMIELAKDITVGSIRAERQVDDLYEAAGFDSWDWDAIPYLLDFICEWQGGDELPVSVYAIVEAELLRLATTEKV